MYMYMYKIELNLIKYFFIKLKMLLKLIICLLFVSSFGFQKINFRKPKCNLYYINNIHKYMLQNQKPENSLVINNMMMRFAKQSGKTLGHVKSCLAPEKTVNKK